MSEFNPSKLTVNYNDGITETSPIIPRRYTLTHSDITAELFLNIGKNYAQDEIDYIMRDEVLGEFIKKDNEYYYIVNLHVDDNKNLFKSTIRNRIFIRELPLALKAIRYGDNEFFTTHEFLDNVPILVRFNSSNPYYNRIENWGTFSDYKTTPEHNTRIENYENDKYLLDSKIGDVNGDGIFDEVSLYGIKPDGDDGIFIEDITLVIEDGNDGKRYTIDLKENAGYNPTLFLGDFTGDKTNDILISIDSGGSGGYGFYYVYSFIDNTPEILFDFQLLNEYYLYDVIYKDNYKVNVINKTLGKQFLIDISKKDTSYLLQIYDTNGNLKLPVKGYVSALNALYPIDFDRNGIYELYAIQKIIGLYNADILGLIETPLRYNGQRFIAIEGNQNTAISGTTIRCVPITYQNVDLTFVDCKYSNREKNINLEKAMIEDLNLRPQTNKVRYYYNEIDLNNDGINEIFVYLVGPAYCGTGGCTGAIFTKDNDEYSLMTKFTLVNNPIIISDNITNGYKDIIMFVSGGGINSYLAELKYDGNNYPTNPSIQPSVKSGAKISGTAIISDNLTNYSGIEL